MPATVTRSLENTAETLESSHHNGPSVPVHEYEPDFVASSRVSGASPPDNRGVENEDEREQGVEWREVAPMVDRFTNETPERDRKRRRGLHKRHRNFVMSGVFWVGLLFGIELVGLVFLYSIDLQAIRHDKALQNGIDKTSLDIALAQNKLAASNSLPRLEAWAGELGYHKVLPTEMDDVTSSAPAPVATPMAAE